MLPNHPEIVLYQPEIPQNTGNIGRLAAATGCRLHLIRPFGFSTGDKNLRRAGLDYWPYLDLEIHDQIGDVLCSKEKAIAFFSTKAKKNYTDMDIQTKILIFGQETSGLPQDLHDLYPERFFNIPMYHPGVRSLNLSNAAAIVVYHQLSQMRKSSS